MGPQVRWNAAHWHLVVLHWVARRYAEVVPEADVVTLADDIGHWPQIEAPDAVLTIFLAHNSRLNGYVLVVALPHIRPSQRTNGG